MATKKKSDPAQYTKPELREKIKKKVMAGDKGGSPGQWSARKAQLVSQEYEKEGGDYKKPRTAAQKSLKNWGDENQPVAAARKKAVKKSTAKRK